MAAGEGGEGGGVASGSSSTRSLQDTPTWALATAVFIFVLLGLFIEHMIHLVGHWLKKHRKTALYEAFEKLKSVLMLLGFMSLMLAVTQRPISKICIPNKVANSMLPCRHSTPTKTTKAYQHIWTDTLPNSLSEGVIFEHMIPRPERGLASTAVATGSSAVDHCESKGMTSLISQGGINQLNIFIFVLAVMQIVYSVATMALGRAKMRRWKNWEKETQTVEYQAANDPNRFRLAKQTTFGRRHMNRFTTTSTQLWIKCFFRQFFHSVAKVDYLTLRHGFIAAHLSTTNNSFNFRKYIQRSLEDDFKVVVGISPIMWFIVVIFLLVDVHGWNVYLWVSFIPLIMVLLIGTKLEVIVAKMALQIKDQQSVIIGTPLVQPNDNLFWFSRPQLFLSLLHFTLFMNAFEVAFFVWVSLQFGITSCYHDHVEIIIIRMVLAVMVQVLCSYITLPLYALVTQMGSKFKSAALEEQTVHAIKKWHTEVREKRKKRPFSQSPSPTVWSNSRTNSPDLSSHQGMPTLADFNSRGGIEIAGDRREQELVPDETGPDEISPIEEMQMGMVGMPKTSTT